MTYFKGIKTIEDLKEKYRDLCKQLHPDNGGDTRAFQDMRNEFTNLFKTLKNVHRTAAAQDQEEDQEEEAPEEFASVIAKVAGFDVDIEIIGRWVWLSGNTYQYKDGIKAAGFFWSSKHKKWYWNGGTTKSRKHSRMSYETIKAIHGYSKVKSGHTQAWLATA